MNTIQITVETLVNAPITKVWDFWTEPKHIINWNTASDDWHTPNATNDLRAGGRFNSRMEAKDGSFGFDFSGVYTNVQPMELIEYTLDDDRKVKILFTPQGENIMITETFDAEEENTVELQQFGWQCILNNFKKYTETN